MPRSGATPLQFDTSHELHQRVIEALLPASAMLGLLITIIAEVMHWPLRVSVFGLLFTIIPLGLWALRPLKHGVIRWAVVLGYCGLSLLAQRMLAVPAAVCLLPVPVGLASLLLTSSHGFILAFAMSLLLLVGGGLLGVPELLGRILAAAGIWAMQGLIWATMAYAQQAYHWWSASYGRMRELLEEARTQRVNLKQTQEDLGLANRELARLSERLAALRTAAEESRRAKEEFVANVSHELRTPLNMILGFSEMILKAPRVYGGALPPKLLADIEVILSSSRHLASLVDDVLDLSQVDARRMALDRKWTTPSEIIEAAAAAVRPLFESKGLHLEIDAPTDLPSIFCDQVRIRQVVLNLLSNAGRYTEQGGVRVRIRQQGGDLVFSVSDTGPGIPPEARERIFEPFSRADSSIRRRFGGSGLGLAISKRFVELHSGKIWYESEVGRGTTFHFSLPMQESPAAGQASVSRWFGPYHEYTPRTGPSKAPPPRLAPRYVVLETGDTLTRLLGRYHEGAEVVAVQSPEAAVTEVSRLPAQALIVNTPAFRRAFPPNDSFSGLPYGTPVIMCWAPGRQEAAEQLGLVQYLLKPASQEALLATLDSLQRPVKTVLVVDDEPEALQLYGRMLAAAGRGYRVLRAPTGERALALLRERRPDVLLLDLVMPGMDGYGVLHEKSLDPQISHIPVVAITARDPAQGPIASDFLSVLRSGGFNLQELLSAISAISATLAPPDRLDPTRPETPRG
jgi:signal transduction histidine kinase/CheY-like chemotaxis protein